MPTIASLTERKPRADPGPGPPTDPHPARSKGRPKKHDERVSREDIVRATGELLATTSVHRLTSAAIARRAGVNPALINYYFKTRSDLLAATALALLKTVWGDTDFGMGPAGLDPRARLRRRIRALLDVMRANPFLHRLVIEEVVHSSSPDARAAFEELTDGGLAGYRMFLDAGVEKGELRPAPPVFLYMAAIGMCEFFASGEPILKHALGDSARADELADSYVDFVCDMILQGLKPR